MYSYGFGVILVVIGDNGYKIKDHRGNLYNGSWISNTVTTHYIGYGLSVIFVS
jgi:hypothetical protein